MVWPVRLAIREGVCNALAGRWVSILVVVTVTWLTAATGLGSAWEVSRLVQAETQWWQDGGGVLVARSTDEQQPGLDAARCDQVNSIDAVVGAYGATVSTRTVAPLPGVRATLVSVTPGVFRFHELPPPTTASLLTGPASMADLKLNPGHEVFLNGISTEVVEIPSSTLPPELGGTWLSPELLAGPAELCVVKVQPGHQSGVARFLEAHLASRGGDPAVVVPLLPTPRDFVAEYRTRPLAWGWVLTAALLGGVWALVSWLRRDRAAIYTTFGAHPQARLMIQWAEWATLSVPASCWGWGIAMAWAIALHVEPMVALTQVSATVVASWTGASLVAVVIGLVPIRSLLQALKE